MSNLINLKPIWPRNHLDVSVFFRLYRSCEQKSERYWGKKRYPSSFGWREEVLSIPFLVQVSRVYAIFVCHHHVVCWCLIYWATLLVFWCIALLKVDISCCVVFLTVPGYLTNWPLKNPGVFIEHVLSGDRMHWFHFSVETLKSEVLKYPLKS